jgi:N utilization substance protein A
VWYEGSRIHGIVRELGNENIDVINYTSNIQLYITRALSPAKVSSIKINEETKRAEVFKLEVSKAIGRGGHNIKLAVYWGMSLMLLEAMLRPVRMMMLN